ncbi:MAG: WD40/YVTN/BNR-like repeat-containing protein [Opitutales bacterium]
MKPATLFLAAAALLLASTAPAAPATPHRLYAALAMTKAQINTSVPSDSGVYVRQADGAWKIFGPRVLGINSLAVQPGSHGKVILIASADGVVRSTDGGKTWRLTTGWEVIDVRSFAYNPANPGEVYASTCWGPLRSTNGGATWELAQTGLNLLYGQTLVADTQTPGRVLLGTEDGIYLSNDGAKTWARTASPPTLALRLAQSAADPKLLLMGSQGRGAWLSHDSGVTWTQTDPGSDRADLYAVALDPHRADRLAVGGWGVGVRVSADGGKTWTDRSAGLPNRNIFVLAFDPDQTDRLWASTLEDGTFYSDDLGATWKSGGLDGAYGLDFVFVPVER